MKEIKSSQITDSEFRSSIVKYGYVLEKDFSDGYSHFKNFRLYIDEVSRESSICGEEAEKFSVINEILGKLTPRRVVEEILLIQGIDLPYELKEWVAEYEKVGERPSFLWKWIYRSVQIITSPTVSEKYQRSLWVTKTLIIMFITLLDDVSDRTMNKVLLDELLKIPPRKSKIDISSLSEGDKRYLDTAEALWSHIRKRIQDYPRYREFKDLFEYDIFQVLHVMRYSFLVNQNPLLINKIESWLYPPYNMQGFVSYTVDLMCSPGFSKKNLNILRKLIWFLQNMAKIGNWVSTWERELMEGDYTSGVIAYVLDNEILSHQDLMDMEPGKAIKLIKDKKIEQEILKKWEQNYHRVKEIGRGIEEIDTQEILDKAEKLLILHLSSRGKK